jgi:hypothetical protein
VRLLGFLVKIAVIFMLVSVERTIGVPMAFLMVVTIVSTQLPELLTYIWLFVAAMFLQALFVIPWFVSMIIIVFLYIAWKQGKFFLPSETLRLLLLCSAASGLVVFLSPGRIDSTAIAYVIFIVVGLLVVLKRERLQPKQWRRFG